MQSYCGDHDFYGAKRIVVPASARPLWVLGIYAQALLGNNRAIGHHRRAKQRKAWTVNTVLTYDGIPHPWGRHLIFDAGNADVVAGLHGWAIRSWAR